MSLLIKNTLFISGEQCELAALSQFYFSVFFIFGLWRGEKQRQISLTHSEQA
jgi:hypothetical protein